MKWGDFLATSFWRFLLELRYGFSDCKKQHHNMKWAGTQNFYKIACAPIEELDRPAHLCSLICLRCQHLVKVGFLGYPYTKADLSLGLALMQSCRKYCVPAQIVFSEGNCSAYGWHYKMSHRTTKPTKRHVRPRRPRSAWVFAQSNKSLRCALNG